ncbi:MAG: hypothetical protein A2156_09865 [Deltaproteobacteria bacterium RBG_16_48_10]|nr:MAG: hypothetical protein A2156_09865 [Deltaproteobacteria bacterium RBG_16_48_10]
MGFMIFLLIRVFKYNPMIYEISNGRLQMASFERKAYLPSGVCLPEAGVDPFPWNGLNIKDEDPIGLT